MGEHRGHRHEQQVDQQGDAEQRQQAGAEREQGDDRRDLHHLAREFEQRHRAQA
jgi:hypothetical protein